MKHTNLVPVAGGSRRPRLTALAAAVASIAIIGASSFGGATAANASTGTVSDLGVSVSFDGTAGFDADDAPGHDSGANNGIVRSNDQVEYLLASSFSTVGDVTFTSTLPVGMEWDSTSTASTVCNGPGGGVLSNSNRTWTCNRTADTSVESFKVRAWVSSAGHGSVVAPTFTSGSVSTTAPGITVSALAQTELSFYVQAMTMPFQNGGADGARQQLSMYLGATLPASGNYKGYEALSPAGYSYQISVPPNAVVLSIVNNSSGTTSFIQPGGPGTPVTITMLGTKTDFMSPRLGAGNAANYRTVSESQVYIWTPYDPSIPANVRTVLAGQITGFDPVSSSGASNFGSGYAPGHDPATTCTGEVASSIQTSCYGQSVLRTDTPEIYAGVSGAQYSPGKYLYGDDHGFTNGREFIVPGQSFIGLTSVRNDPTAGAASTGVWGVTAWDPKLLELSGTPQAWLNTANGSTNAFHVTSGTPLPTSDYTLQYTDHSFANDAERKSFDPGSLSWVSNPAALPGGMKSVSAVLVKYNGALPINSILGLVNPLTRPLTDSSMAIAANTALPWFWQYGSDDRARQTSNYGGTGVSDRGGNIRTASALIRSTAAWNVASTEPGQVKSLVVTPVVIGPVGGTTSTVSKNSRLTVTFDSTCGEPVWDVVTNLPGYKSHTPGNPGPDGIMCTADDGAPASIVFNLGDVEAPAGAVGPSVYQGHGTNLPTITIPVNVSVLTPSGSIHTATIVASSDSDFSTASFEGWSNIAGTALSQDRTEKAALTVQGVASFQGGKTANTREAGIVSPDEEFSYTINWANGTSDKVGVGTFVDLLPYNGDARGSNGLPAEGFTVIEAVTSTANEAVMGKVSVEYSVDDAEDIAAALLQTDNSDGHTGITWKSGEIPLNARALRFVTEKPIDSGFSGSATITVALKGLAIGGQLKNDFYGKTAAVDGDPNSIKRIVGAAEVTLASSAGSLSGTAWRDLDYSNGFTPEDVVWPKGSKTLTITSTNETYTTDIGDDGSFDFGVIAAGDYVASVKDAKGWTLVLPNPISFAIGQELDDVKILFQEKLTDLALKPDTGSTSAGASTVIDVKKNDSWYTASAPAPQTAASIQAGGEATYGTATITRDGSLTYVSSATWPAEFDGQDSYEDIVAYTVTDSAGATATTAVTITVYAAPVATNDAVTIGQSGSTAADALANDTGRKLVLGNTVLASGDLSVSVADGKVSVESTHEWADGEATYNDVVSYSVTDDFGQTADAEIVVTVQRAPVVTVDAAQTVATGESARFEPQLLNPGVIADDGVAVTKQPAGGTVAVAADGTVSFDHGSAQPGEYTFTVTYTDNLGQQTEQAFTVTVYAALAPVDDSKTVPWTAATTTDVLANDGGDGLTLTAASTTDETESSGLVEVVGDGIRFTPSANRQWAEGELNYIEIVKYTVTDGHGGESRATLTLTVIRPPVGKDVHFELTNDVDLLTFDPVGEASGTDVQEIDADAVVTQAAHGTASVTNGVLGYTPKPGYVGEDTFSVRIVDALGQTGEVTYTLTILAADVPEPKPTLPNTGGTEVPMNPTPGTAAPSEGGTAGATGSGHNGAPGNPALAVTGSDHSPIAAIAMLLLLGGCLVAAARRHNVPGGQRTL